MRAFQHSKSDPLSKILEALPANKQVPASIPGTSTASNTSQQQSLQAQMDTITKKLDSLTVSQSKENKIAAYSGTENDGQPALMKRIQELEYHMARLDRRINQQRSRDLRPLCHYCGAVGHFLVSCPQRDLHERGPVPRNTLPPPENTERNHYHVATLTESCHDSSNSDQPTEQHERHAQQVPSQLNSIAAAATESTSVITSFAANGTMTMKTLNTFSTWGSHSLAAGRTGTIQ